MRIFPNFRYCIDIKGKSQTVHKYEPVWYDGLMNNQAAWLAQFIDKKEGMSPSQQRRLITHIGRVPFSTDLVAVDPGLWGGFWHFDVIAAGYTLPAVELALLRAVRLDQMWPAATTVEQFVGDLRQTIGHPQAEVWLLRVIDQPCAVLAAPAGQPGLITVVWYCATTNALHAGYRTAPDRLSLPQAVAQCSGAVFATAGPASVEIEIDQTWLVDSLEQTSEGRSESLSVELDREILRIRVEAGD